MRFSTALVPLLFFPWMGRGKELDQKIAPVQTISIPVDHFHSSSNDTYSNRFWVDATHYKPGGPVIVFNNGEAGVTEGAIRTYLGANASNMVIARRYNGIAVVLEHRYYGRSIPVKIDEETGYAVGGAEAYGYLTTEQALEDMVFLANNFKPEGLKASWEDLHPSKTPWIAIGASYPGMLAVFARLRNPETYFASWASSAPVETMMSTPTYYEQLYQDMTANCSADVAAASRYFDNVLTNGTQKEGNTAKFLSMLATHGVGRLREVLNSSTTELDDEISGLGAYGEFFAAGNVVQMVRTNAFQSVGFTATTLPYCDLIQRYDSANFLNASSAVEMVHSLFGPESNASHIAPSDQGIASEYGDQAAFGAVLYATALHTQFSRFFNRPRSPFKADGPSWNWQHCFENPNHQIANTSSPYNLLSASINVENSQMAECGANSSFPYPIPTANLTANNRFGGWHMRPSNVMFIDGGKDPWHTLSVHSTNTEIGAPNRTSTQEVPPCNEPPPGDAVFGHVFQNGYHGHDLVPSSEAAEAAELFSKALDVWLPCFNATRKGAQDLQQKKICGVPITFPYTLAGLMGILSAVYSLIWYNVSKL